MTYPSTPSRHFVATTAAAQCARARVLKQPSASPESCDRPTQKKCKISDNWTRLDWASSAWAKPTFLYFKPFNDGPLEPKSGANSRGDSSPNSGTFLKFLTLKFLPCPPARFSKCFSTLKFLPCPPGTISSNPLQVYRHFLNF